MPITDANYLTVAPAGLLSTNSFVALAPVDARAWQSLSYTIKVATQSVDWEVFGANASDYSDEVSVQAAAAVVAAGKSSYSTAQAVWGFYRVKIKSTVNDVHGTATVVGIAKAA